MKKLKNIKNKTKEEILVENLKEVKEIFDKHNIKFWLDWGTLLGAIRDRKIIEWDSDIDLGVMASDTEKIISILPELKEKGFFVARVSTKNFFYRSFRIIQLGHLVDVWLYYPENENTLVTFSGGNTQNLILKKILKKLWILWRLLMSDRDEKYLFYSQNYNKLKFIIVVLVKHFLLLFPDKIKKFFAEKVEWILIENNYDVTFLKVVVPSHYFKRLETIKFYGMIVNIPSNVESYLKHKYGEDWKTPNKEWNWVKDDGGVRLLTEYEKKNLKKNPPFSLKSKMS